MEIENPYRAAGTFDGPSYVVRAADGALLRAIRLNQRYPYLLSARQSGKSSLIVHAFRSLHSEEQRPVFIDLSSFTPENLSTYNRFIVKLLSELYAQLGKKWRRADLESEETSLAEELLTLLTFLPGRLIIFVDEIDILKKPGYRDEFFGLVRSMFNQRAWNSELKRVQFVLAGAAPQSQLIQDPNRSPFNVGEKIRLDDLTGAQVATMVQHLDALGIPVTVDLGTAIYSYSSGSVFLTQLILEKMWQAGIEHKIPIFDRTIVDNIVRQIIDNANDEIHFRNIYNSIINNPLLIQAFFDIQQGKQIDNELYEQINITGILGADRAEVFRNRIYHQVFGQNGSLRLVEIRNFNSIPPVEIEKITARSAVEPITPQHSRTILLPARIRPEEPSQIFSSSNSHRGTIFGSLPKELKPMQLADSKDASQRSSPHQRTLLGENETPPGQVPQIGQPSSDREFQSGSIIGKYRLVRQIGQGGMGSVYEATHIEIGGRVALKVMLQHLPNNIRSRFLAEARAISLVQQPGIVQVIDYGLTSEKDLPYIVMEYVTGESLSALVRREALVPLEKSLEIVRQVALALSSIHSAGIVHRDIKPGNIMLVNDPAAVGGIRVKLLDFGIARLLSPDNSNRTAPGVVMGTPAYMPPEQWLDAASVSERSDIYSLGIVLYEMLNGQIPFGGEPLVMANQHISSDIPELYSRNIPQEVRQLLRTMLAKAPQDRPTASGVISALEAFLHGKAPAMGELYVTKELGGLSGSHLGRQSPQRRLLNFILILFVLSLLSLALFRIALRHNDLFTTPNKNRPK